MPAGSEKVPKALLCELGFQDPRLTTLPTSPPTLTSDGESAILQWIFNEVRQKNAQGVLGVHVDWLVVKILLFRKLCNGFGLNLNLEPGNKADFDFVVESCVKSTIENPSRSPCQSLVKKWSPFLFQPCERWSGCAAGSKCALSVSCWCRSAALVTDAGKSTPVGCHWNLAEQICDPNGHDLLRLNKLMREAKSMPDLCWWIVSVPSSFVWLTAADAAWANRPDGSSTSDHVIMAPHPNILRGESSTISMLAWNSRKIRRVARSSLRAECAAFSNGFWNTRICSECCMVSFAETCVILLNTKHISK